MNDKLFIFAFVIGFGGLAICGTIVGLLGAPNVALPGLGICGSGIFVMGLVLMFGFWMAKSIN